MEKMTHIEARLRKHVGAGLRFSYELNGIDSQLFLTLADNQSVTEMSTWECYHGHFALSTAEPILNLMSLSPALLSLPNNMTWTWSLYNHGMSPDLRSLFGELKPRDIDLKDMLEIDSLTLLLRIVQNEHQAQSLIMLPLTMLQHLLDNSNWIGIKQLKLPSIRLKIPIIVSQIHIALAELNALQPGGVLLPKQSFFDLNGNGVVSYQSVHLHGTLFKQKNLMWALTLMDISMINSESNILGHQEENIEENSLVTFSEKEYEDNEMFSSEMQPFIKITSDINSLQLPLHIQCGRLIVPLRSLQHLAIGSVLISENSAPEEAELCYMDQVIARGTLVNVAGRVGFKVTEMSSWKTETSVNSEPSN